MSALPSTLTLAILSKKLCRIGFIAFGVYKGISTNLIVKKSLKLRGGDKHNEECKENPTLIILISESGTLMKVILNCFYAMYYCHQKTLDPKL